MIQECIYGCIRRIFIWAQVNRLLACEILHRLLAAVWFLRPLQVLYGNIPDDDLLMLFEAGDDHTATTILITRLKSINSL